MEQMQKPILERVLLVGIHCGRDSGFETDERSLDELSSLVETAGGEALGQVIQNREHPDTRTFIGEGKVEECRAFIENLEITLAVFDNELSPSQIRNLEEELGVRVIDRSMLILDIFALHAVTREGKLQVELAQLKYTMPRLMGKGTELSRLGGGIGTRGPGESKLETDRRHVRRRVAALEEELAEVKKNRQQQRRQRDSSGLPRVAIVGYTNAGKSTLLNLLTGAGVLAQDKLFVTLDPTTRKYRLGDGVDILLTDTVGFVRNLPHHLVEAFASTLEELRYADVLLHVVDISDPQWESHIEVTDQLLRQLEAEEKPVIRVLNKADQVHFTEIPVLPASVAISAKLEQGVDRLLELLLERVSEGRRRVSLLLPFDRAGALPELYSGASVHSCEYTDGGIEVELTAPGPLLGKYRDYIRERE